MGNVFSPPNPRKPWTNHPFPRDPDLTMRKLGGNINFYPAFQLSIVILTLSTQSEKKISIQLFPAYGMPVAVIMD
jgi:hypothetical protein